ncbi:hypothetical protein UlMin_026794 [Ulmus minor]
MASNMLNQGPLLGTNRLPFVDLHILVVDDDSTTLAIVSTILRNWSYQVVAVKNPMDALSTLRIRKDFFDLVVTDLHMPYMDGFELSSAVDKEFKIPVVMMSADDKESVMLKSFQYGTALFIEKPVNPDDLKNVWQYTLAGTKGKSVVVDCHIFPGESSGSYGTISNEDTMNSVGKLIRMDTGRNSNYYKFDPNQMMANYPKAMRDGFGIPKSPRKTKVIWTSWLHNLFLLAIDHIGLDKAVPNRILKFMNVSGLTRENVASHLQKYRMFLKRVAEKGLARGESSTFLDRLDRSCFATGDPELWLRHLEQSYAQYCLNNASFLPVSEIRQQLTGRTNNITTVPLPTSNLSTFHTFPSLASSSITTRIGQFSLVTDNHCTNFQYGFSTGYNGSLNGVFMGQNQVGSSSSGGIVRGNLQFPPGFGNTIQPQNGGWFVTGNQVPPVHFPNRNQARNMGRFVSVTPINGTFGFNNYLGQGQSESSSSGGFYPNNSQQQNAGGSFSSSALPLQHVVGGNNGGSNMMSNIPTENQPGIDEVVDPDDEDQLGDKNCEEDWEVFMPFILDGAAGPSSMEK